MTSAEEVRAARSPQCGCGRAADRRCRQCHADLCARHVFFAPTQGPGMSALETAIAWQTALPVGAWNARQRQLMQDEAVRITDLTWCATCATRHLHTVAGSAATLTVGDQ